MMREKHKPEEENISKENDLNRLTTQMGTKVLINTIIIHLVQAADSNKNQKITWM